MEQQVEYLIDSNSCIDATLQAAIGIVRANTNGMRGVFESASSSLIEVDPYQCSYRGGHTEQVSGIDFSACHGNTGINIRWHSKKQFASLS